MTCLLPYHTTLSIMYIKQTAAWYKHCIIVCTSTADARQRQCLTSLKWQEMKKRGRRHRLVSLTANMGKLIAKWWKTRVLKWFHCKYTMRVKVNIAATTLLSVKCASLITFEMCALIVICKRWMTQNTTSNDFLVVQTPPRVSIHDWER